MVFRCIVQNYRTSPIFHLKTSFPRNHLLTQTIKISYFFLKYTFLMALYVKHFKLKICKPVVLGLTVRKKKKL